MLAPILFTILFVWIARLFKRATSQRGAAKVAVGTLALFALGSCGGLLSAVSATSKASATSAEPKSAAQRAELTAASAANIHDKKIDSVTWLKHVKAAGDTVVYDYQMAGINANELDPAIANAFRRQLVDKACGNAELRGRLLSHGVVMRYHYYDWMGRTITAVDVTEEVCADETGSRA